MKPPSNCPRCTGRMSQGFVLDQGYGQAQVATWQSGEPTKSFWLGVKQTRADQIEVVSFRCDRCGYLESYAPG